MNRRRLLRVRGPLRNLGKLSGLAVSRLRGRPIAHFIHIGKTAGSAVKAALWNDRKSGSYTLYLHRHDFKLRDTRPGEKVFFVVRDPIKRFISAFYSRQRQGRPRYYAPWNPAEAKAFTDFQTPNELAEALSSEDERTCENATAAMRGIVHVRNSYWDWFGDEQALSSRISDILFVADQAHLDRDFARLIVALGIPGPLALPGSEVQKHQTPASADRQLSADAEKNLREWYARDYEFLELLRSNNLL